MNYTAKTRSRSGAIEYVEVEAADKGSAIRELKRRGISPISIELGKAPSVSPGRRPRRTAMIVACAACVAAACVAVLLFLGRRGPSAGPEPEAKKEKVRAVATPKHEAPKKAETVSKPAKEVSAKKTEVQKEEKWPKVEKCCPARC